MVVPGGEEERCKSITRTETTEECRTEEEEVCAEQLQHVCTTTEEAPSAGPTVSTKEIESEYTFRLTILLFLHTVHSTEKKSATRLLDVAAAAATEVA